MPFPTTSILDNFNRADEGPPPTGWTAWFSPGLKVVSNQCAPADSGDDGGYWTSAMPGTDVEAYISMPTLPPADVGWLWVMARSNPTGAGFNGTCYAIEYAPLSGTDTIKIFSFADGVSTQLGSTFNQDLAAGDKVGIRCQGSTIEAWASISGTWTLMGSVTDTTYPGTGSQNKLAIYTGGATSQRFDDFGGGPITRPQGPVVVDTAVARAASW